MLTVKGDADSIFMLTVPGRKNPLWVPTPELRKYEETLTAIRGMTLHSCHLQGGLLNCHYAILPGPMDGFFHRRPSSKIIALDDSLVEKSDRQFVPPIPDGPSMTTGLDIVRVLTAWVDGFHAFYPCTPENLVKQREEAVADMRRRIANTLESLERKAKWLRETADSLRGASAFVKLDEEAARFKAVDEDLRSSLAILAEGLSA